MSRNQIFQTLRKKVNDTNIRNHLLEKKIMSHNKLLNSKKFKIKKDEDFLCEISNELLNEKIILSGIKTPLINPIPCFTVRNDNYRKKNSARGTFFQIMNSQEIINKEDNKRNIDNKVKINDKVKKIKLLNEKSQVNRDNNLTNNKSHSPIFKRTKNKISDSLNISNDLNNKTNYKLSNNKKIIKNIKRHKLNKKKHILAYKKIRKNNNQLFHSTDNCFESILPYKEIEMKDKEKGKNKRISLIKSLWQKINVASMKIEILENYNKNQFLKTLKKKIEYNKILNTSNLKTLKDKYYNNINQHLKQINYLKMKELKFQQQFLEINKHQEIINKEELKFKLKKMQLIEKIIFLQKILNDFLNPESTNDTYTVNDSFEEQTIKDLSFNDNSIIKDSIGLGKNFNNKALFNDEALYESKIIKIKPKDANIFIKKFIKVK